MHLTNKQIREQKEIQQRRAIEEAKKWKCPKCSNTMDKAGVIQLEMKGDPARSGPYCQHCYFSWMATNIPMFIKTESNERQMQGVQEGGGRSPELEGKDPAMAVAGGGAEAVA